MLNVLVSQIILNGSRIMAVGCQVIPCQRQGVIDEEALASIIRATGGNFRLLHRLLTQIARIVEINVLQAVTGEVVEAARESLVIGTS